MSNVLRLYMVSIYRKWLLRTSNRKFRLHSRYLSCGSKEDDGKIIQLIQQCEKISPKIEYHIELDADGCFSLREPFFACLYDLDEFRRAALDLKKLELTNYFLIDGQLVSENTSGKLLPEIPWTRIVFDVEGDHPLDELSESLNSPRYPVPLFKHRLLPVKRGLTYDLETGELAIFGKEVKAPIFIAGEDVNIMRPLNSDWISVGILRQFLLQYVEKFDDGDVVRVSKLHYLNNLYRSSVYHVRHLRNPDNLTICGLVTDSDHRGECFYIEPDPLIEKIGIESDALYFVEPIWREVP